MKHMISLMLVVILLTEATLPLAIAAKKPPEPPTVFEQYNISMQLMERNRLQRQELKNTAALEEDQKKRTSLQKRQYIEIQLAPLFEKIEFEAQALITNKQEVLLDFHNMIPTFDSEEDLNLALEIVAQHLKEEPHYRIPSLATPLTPEQRIQLHIQLALGLIAKAEIAHDSAHNHLTHKQYMRGLLALSSVMSVPSIIIALLADKHILTAPVSLIAMMISFTALLSTLALFKHWHFKKANHRYKQVSNARQDALLQKFLCQASLSTEATGIRIAPNLVQNIAAPSTTVDAPAEAENVKENTPLSETLKAKL